MKSDLKAARRRGGLEAAHRRTPEERSEFARKAAIAKNKNLTKSQRSESARKAALARWRKPEGATA